MFKSLIIFVVSSLTGSVLRPLIFLCLLIYGGEYLADVSTDGKKSVIRSIGNQLPEDFRGVFNQIARGAEPFLFSDEDLDGKPNTKVANKNYKAQNLATYKQQEQRVKNTIPGATFVDNVVKYYNELSGGKYDISDSLGYELYSKQDRNFAIMQGYEDSKKAIQYIMNNKILGRKFFNREGLLPSGGNYYEYDLYKLTPQSEDRGTHRIVIDLNSSSALYTPDHYKTFIPVK